MDTAFTPAHRGGAGSPLVCVHGFTDSWRTWEPVLGALEAEHDVLAPTLPGHAGGPPLPAEPTVDGLIDAVEQAMDDAGFDTAHVVGNSLGGFVALRLAARGRARSVVALAPAGGWAGGDETQAATMAHFVSMHEQLQPLVPHADAIMATEEGRRRATTFTAVRFEHLPPDLLAHQLRGAAACDVPTMAALTAREGWSLDAAAIACPVRVVWGTEDRLLPWPSAAARYREEWLPHADWVQLDGVGHCPQLDVPTETAQLILGVTS